MFTIFHLFELTGSICGAFFGGMVGFRTGAVAGSLVWGGVDLYSGIFGAVLGALLGLILGYNAGTIPWRASMWLILRKLKKKSVEELRRELKADPCHIPNMILAELARRGENTLADLNAVLDLLESNSPHNRQVGWAALLSAFPRLADEIKFYSPSRSVEVYRERIEALRKTHASADGVQNLDVN
jgi:hypothetical protein